MTERTPYVVQVAGDPTVDWLVVAPSVDSTNGTSPTICVQPGGSALLTQLLKAVCSHKRSPRFSVRGVTLPAKLRRSPLDMTVTRTYSLWQPYPRRAGEKDNLWRMDRLFGLREPGEKIPFSVDDESAAPPSCLVIDDAGMGSFDRQEFWPACLQDPNQVQPAQVIVKAGSAAGATARGPSGPLWEKLVEAYGSFLTAYFGVNDFRRGQVRISQALSWERISSEVIQAVREHKDLSQIARVVVSLGASGAVVVERDGVNSLVFDPFCQEGDWERERPGTTMGLGTCIVASLAAQCAYQPETPDWLEAVKKGLEAARDVHESGYLLDNGQSGSALPFAADRAAAVLCGESDNGVFQKAEISSSEGWTILEQACHDGYRTASEQVVLQGEQRAFSGVPVERMGQWVSVDRTEIESMRSVRNIIGEYVAQPQNPRPLNIAVFGPPGAGKSFAIKQMSRQWLHGDDESNKPLVFNLSQFNTSDQLAAAFQQVRDRALKGTRPVVFWDEFDAPLGDRALGWLPYFLAPMQDGEFMEDGATRPIGQAIFVFAGGIYATMADFKKDAASQRGIKATDFLSRLRGFIDVLGPDPAEADRESDKAFVLRRAFLLRSLLKRRAPQVFTKNGTVHIDRGVLRAFLGVGRYLHGSRSMETIVEVSALSGKLSFERSALPARHQLNIHVDAEQFMDLVKQQAPG